MGVKIVAEYKPLMQFLKLAAIVGPEVRINFGDNNIWFIKTDTGNVQLIGAKLFCDVSGDTDNPIATNTEWILEILRRIKADKVKMVADEKHLTIFTDNVKFTVELFDPDTVYQNKKPELDIPVEYEVDTDLLIRALTILNSISDFAEFSVKGGEVILWGKGDIEKAVIKLGSVNTEEEHHTRVNPSLLLPVLKVIRDLKVKVAQGTQIPLKISASNDMLEVDTLTAPLLIED